MKFRHAISNSSWLVILAFLTKSSQVLGLDDVEIPFIGSISNELSYDENDRLSSYYLVFPEIDMKRGCPGSSQQYNRYGFKKAVLRSHSEAMEQVFPNYDYDQVEKDEDDYACHAAILERGAERSIAGYPMPNKIYKAPENFHDWLSENGSKVEVCLLNYYDEESPLQVYWVPENGGDPKPQGRPLRYGMRYTNCFHSFLGHQFRVEHTSTKEILTEFTVEYPLSLGFGAPAPHGKDVREADFTDEIHSTLRHEWEKKDIPQRTFSPLGFSKGRLPNDIFATMGAFYYNNRMHKTREEWEGKGVFVNWWETDVYMIQIPWGMKDIWQHRLVDLVSEWSGVQVEQTMMYGLRQYEEGARLLTHVDRLHTHVLSSIVNVAQGGLEEDWPIEVFDHYGRLHEVVMQPGDMVFYESAKALHSRNRPLKGKGAHYLNLFTHYRPVGEGDEWYLKTTETGREPVLEGEGSCYVPEEVVSKETEHLGYGKVKCDDPRLGSNISPMLFQLKNADDLIAWWQRTSPNSDDNDGMLVTSPSADEASPPNAELRANIDTSNEETGMIQDTSSKVQEELQSVNNEL